MVYPKIWGTEIALTRPQPMVFPLSLPHLIPFSNPSPLLTFILGPIQLNHKFVNFFLIHNT